MANAILNVGQTGGQVNISTAAAPATPAAGVVTLYAGTDKALHALNSDGTDITIAAAGAASPITVVQTNSLVSTAVGGTATAAGSVVIGATACAVGVNSVVIGTCANTAFGNSIVIGLCASGSGSCQTVIGECACSTSQRSVVIGLCSRSTQETNIAIGPYVCNSSDRSVAVGTFVSNAGSEGVVVGYGSQNSGIRSVNISSSNCSTGSCSVSLGTLSCNQSNCSFLSGASSRIFPGATGTIVLGSLSNGGTGASNSVVIGNSSRAAIIDSVVIGCNIQAPANICVGSEGRNNYNILIGRNICLSNNIALGQCCNVVIGSLASGNPGNESVSIGWGNTLSSSYSDVAIGTNARALAGHSLAMMQNACASGFIALSIGLNSGATQMQSIAIGHNATSTHTGAVALGQGISTEKTNTTHVNSLIAYGQAASKTNAVGSTGGSVTLNWDNSNIQTLTLTSNITTLTKSNPIDGAVYTLFLTQGGTGGKTVSWGTDVEWPGGTPPTLSTAAGSVDAVSLVYIAGITGYYGNSNLNFS